MSQQIVSSNKNMTSALASNDLKLSQIEIEQFIDWLNLNFDAITWHGNHSKSFDNFLELLFSENLSLIEIIDRLDFISDLASLGPISSWLTWLKERLICFVFIEKKLTLLDLSFFSGVPIKRVATITRNYFVQALPYMDDYFNHFFHVTHLSDKNAINGYLDIEKKIGPSRNVKSHHDEIMTNLEITLYSDWHKVHKKMQKKFSKENIDTLHLTYLEKIKGHLKIARDISIMLILSYMILSLIVSSNKWYEHYIGKQIKQYGTDIFSIAQKLKFYEPQNNNLKNDDIKSIAKDFANVNKEELPTSNIAEEVFTTESDIFVTSLSDVPKHFDIAKHEQSLFEENKKGGYRDLKYGNKNVYRVMMKSVEPLKSKSEVDKLLTKYGATQVDQVKPGIVVPGGIYYNIFVPIEHLQEFLAQVVEVDRALLFHNKTSAKIPPGMNKVLIWIKSI